jgi:hypothetical protein
MAAHADAPAADVTPAAADDAQGAATGVQGADAAAVQTMWLVPSYNDSVPLPTWLPEEERIDHRDTIADFRTKPCEDFIKGFCAKHGGKGKACQCFCYHFDSQYRRSPVDKDVPRLLYWDTPCPHWSPDLGYCCPMGPGCVFAHGRDEVSYHPAKYKTRMCNGHECRGEAICCFAHDKEELRAAGPEKYAYASLAASSSKRSGWDGASSAAWGAAMGMGGNRGGASVGLQKHRFCASYPNVGMCRRGAACVFAHSRDEVRTELCSELEESHDDASLCDDFFTQKFKTLWCPIGAQHDWQNCVYAHTYQDARRKPSIGYGPQPCPYWSKKDTRLSYLQRCPLGLRCPFSHGAKEQLYHPKYFRTVVCRDMKLKGCPRQQLCAFFHNKVEQRSVEEDKLDYKKPLKKDMVPQDWAQYFLSPPFSQEGNDAESLFVDVGSFWVHMNPEMMGQMPQGGGGSNAASADGRAEGGESGDQSAWMDPNAAEWYGAAGMQAYMMPMGGWWGPAADGCAAGPAETDAGVAVEDAPEGANTPEPS